jgi:hypothetical protein
MEYRVDRLDKGMATYLTNYLIVILSVWFGGKTGHLELVSIMFISYALGNLIAGYMHQFLKPMHLITDIAWISAQAFVIVSNFILLVILLQYYITVPVSLIILGVLGVVGGTIHSEKVATVLGGSLSVISSLILVYSAFHFQLVPHIATLGFILNIVYVALFIFSSPSKWINFWLHMLAIGYYSTLYLFFTCA